MKGSNLLWRGVLILAILVIAAVLAFPLDKKINLGLDLRGGMHLVLQVHTEDALRAETDSDMDRIAQLAQEEGGRRAGPPHADDAFEITRVDARRAGQSGQPCRGRTATRPRRPLADREPRQRAHRLRDERRRVQRRSATQRQQGPSMTIDNRINAYGVGSRNIAVTDGYRILVQLPAWTTRSASAT